MKKIVLIFSCIYLLLNISFAQNTNKIDSLKRTINLIKSDSVLISTLIDIAYLYENSEPDTSVNYYKKALNISKKTNNNKKISYCLNIIGYVLMYQGNYDEAINYYTEALQFNKQTGNIHAESNNYINLGVVFFYKSNYEKAIEYYTKALKINEQLNDTNNIANNLGDIGSVYYSKCNYEQAIIYFQKSLDIYEKINDKNGIAKNLGNIGNVYFVQNNFPKTLEYYLKALKIQQELGEKINISTNYTNIGSVYLQSNDLKKALLYYNKALNLKTEISDKRGIALNLENIASVYTKKKLYKKSIEYFKKSLKINKEIGNLYGVAGDLGGIADVYLKLKEYDIAIKYAQENLKISKKIGALDKEEYTYSILSDSYVGLKNYKKGIEYKNLWISINDSIYSKEKTKAIADLQTKYDTEKKEKQILLQKAELKTSQFEILKEKTEKEKQQSQRNMFIIAFGIMILLAILIYRSYRQKRKANILLAEQKNEIILKNEALNQQNEEIRTQSEEIKNQRDIVVSQKNELEKVHLKISESIDYAQRIQNSILPNTLLLERYLADNFLLFKPKDKVSGDFYWWSFTEGQLLVAAADSTGHGVPGAFMSMLGGSFLREIIQKEYITHTGVILRKLRKEIIRALKQKGDNNEQKDGMDIAIVSINQETKLLQFSGANNPIYLIRNSELQILNEDNKVVKFRDNSKLSIKTSKILYEIKPDKMPVSIYRKMDKFSNYEIQLNKGDQIYLFSDGFADQFGGKKGKKFKYKPFKKLLLDNANKPMQEQKDILNYAFENWRDGFEQIDDVLVIGIKI